MTILAPPSKIVLVGLSPGPNTKPEFPIFPYPVNSAGYRLKELMGVSMAVYLTCLDRVNLWPVHMPSNQISRMLLAASAQNLLATMLRGRTIIALGVDVARAFFVAPMPVAELHQLPPAKHHPGRERTRIAWVPHPSGQNRMYNSQETRAQVRVFLRALLQEQGIDPRKGWIDG